MLAGRILALFVTLSTVWAAAPPSKAEPFSLARVRLLEGPFRDAMLRNGEYLMRLSPDRLLAKFRVEAGLDPKAESYGGWEGRDIAGHSLGHYLTGLSLAYAATGDPFFKQRVDYIVDELAACQARNPDKLVDAKTQRRPQVWRELARGEIRGVERHNINGAWVPWYAIHKVYAGLRDAWLYTGNSTAKTVFLNLADWTQTITGKLSEEQMQQMMACEFGGMNEVLADAYALSGKSAHLALARKFEHKAVMDPLAAQHDELAGLHANTQIPKIIGEARLYEVSGDERPRRISEFFFRTVLDRYTYANGGNSDKEWFGKPGAQSEHMSGQMTETCNTYNMLKLAVQLFSWEPRAFLMDYYERALWNQIYNSQDRKTGMFTYKHGLYGGWFQPFSRPEEDFWCCVGSGMENHSKYAEAIYFHHDADLWVNLFIPSELDWSERKIRVRQTTRFPNESSSSLRISTPAPARFAMHLRYPQWAGKAFAIRINGKAWKHGGKRGEFATIDRTWRDGDTVSISMPFELRYEATPDNPNRVAFFYGPVLLAGLFGTANMPEGGPYGKEASDGWKLPNPTIPPLVGLEKPLATWMRPVAGKPLTFTAASAGNPSTVTLVPMWESHHQRFTVYWDAYTTAQWKENKKPGGGTPTIPAPGS